MDISRLLRKRQLNVQEQNAIVEHKLWLEAKFWRENALPLALIEYGLNRGLCWSHTIILDLDINFPGMCPLSGTLLSDKGRFIDFELDTDETHSTLTSVELWQDITDVQNFSTHNKGKGIGYGALALKVQRRLCGEISASSDKP
jgi:hypothetical protein